ncbi:MAG: C10 family peptidase [Bacteroides sp.]|nr:C10 family peptidase [Bacteroides sp.]
MRYKILFLLSLWTLSVFAENISKEEAGRIALEFMKKHPSRLAVRELQMVYDGMTDLARSQGEAPAFYVFDNPEGKGFVIVAGDDIAAPVLGYSYEYDFPEGNLPPNVDGWLQGLKRQINDGRRYGTVPGLSSRSATPNGEVVVQLKTALWNQGTPYNQFCPKLTGGGYDGGFPPTGCVITATAIVMRYHQWPEKGVGTLPEYTYGENETKVPAVELGHVYDWEQMLYEYHTGKYTVEQGEQVARLMADLGVMLQANYGTNETSAYTYNIGKLLSTYMDYDKSALEYDRNEFLEEGWHLLLTQELRAGRPVIYSGSNEKAGHAFVMDGFTTDYYYSINWGWGGYCNGFFLLNALVPNGSGIGGNEDHYNFGQSAVVGLKPDEGGDYVERIAINGTGLSTPAETVEQNQPFVIVTSWVGNKGGGIFNGSVLWALTDRDGNIKEELGGLSYDGLQPNWGWTDLQRTFTITVPIAIGDRIRVFYKSDRTPEWTLVKGGEECVWELLVADEFTIEESTVLRYSKPEGTLVVTTKEGVDVQFLTEAGVPLSEQCSTEGVKTVIRTQGLQAGTYVLQLKKTFETCQVRIKLGDSSM